MGFDHRISKEVSFDAGHRVPYHASKCRNPHGHRYRVVATCIGTVIETEGHPEQGMLIDFGSLKGFMMERIHDVLDHGFIAWENDDAMLKALGMIHPEGTPSWKVIVFPYIPTAENIARWCFEQLLGDIVGAYNEDLLLESVTCWETPTCQSTYPAQPLVKIHLPKGSEGEGAAASGPYVPGV
jgi:6-pyruvoyltetrahydropterin/6-carboxytetrahydropterin synthase